MDRGAWFVVELTCPCSPADALSRVLDLRQHSRVIPLTTVSPALSFEELQVGSEFVARTALGSVGFDDVMTIDELDPRDGDVLGVRIAKHGRAIRGSIHLTAEASPQGSVITWNQLVRLPWLPGFVQPLAARVLKIGYETVLKRLLAEPGTAHTA